MVVMLEDVETPTKFTWDIKNTELTETQVQATAGGYDSREEGSKSNIMLKAMFPKQIMIKQTVSFSFFLYLLHTYLIQNPAMPLDETSYNIITNALLLLLLLHSLDRTSWDHCAGLIIVYVTMYLFFR